MCLRVALHTAPDLITSACVVGGDLVTGPPCYSKIFKHKLHEGLLLNIYVSLSVRPS
jgi:hypothetical protein